MPYQYTAYTEDGSLIRGTADVSSAGSVEEMLWQSNYYITEVRQAPRGTGWRDVFPSFFGVKSKDVIVFTRQLGTLIQSGVSLLRALTVLKDQLPSPTFRQALDDVAQLIETGVPVSIALNRYPLIFTQMYCRMVEVGERTGHLDEVLEQVAVYLEKRDAISSKVRGALSYPLFVLFLAFAVVGLLVNVALPSIVGLFKEFGGQLPWTTQVLLAVVDFSQNHGTKAMSAVALLVVGVVAYWGKPEGRRRLSQLLLGLPLIGPIIITSTVATTARSIAVLLRAGIPLTDVMDLTIASVENPVISEAFERVRTRLLQGHGLAGPLEMEPVFPKLFSQMVRVGEESGSLDAILLTLSDFYEQEADRAIDALTSKIEPALIIVVGGIIGFIAVSILTPMYSVLGSAAA